MLVRIRNIKNKQDNIKWKIRIKRRINFWNIYYTNFNCSYYSYKFLFPRDIIRKEEDVLRTERFREKVIKGRGIVKVTS